MADVIQYPLKSFDVYGGTQTAAELMGMKQLGFGCAIHYYSWTAGKNLTNLSARALTQLGFQIGVVWEADGASISGFGGDKGLAAGNEAVRLAKLVGQPAGSAIYFAVDFGPTPPQLPAIMAYFGAAITPVHAAGYKIGCYGCGDVLTALYHAHLNDYDWLAGALGWGGSRNYVSPYDPSGKPAITQGLEATVNGLDIDPDMVYREAGLFQVAA